MKLTVLDNSNIVESYPGITLPLTYSFVKRAYGGVFKGLIGSKLKNEAALDEFKNIFSNMVASYQGRVYYNINNWYSLIYFLPFPKMIAPVWQDMMGVQNKEIYLEKLRPFSPWRKARLYFNLTASFLRAPKDMDRLARDFESIKTYFNANYSDGLSVKGLWELYREIESKALNKWYVTLHNDMYAFLWTGILKRKLSRKGADVTKYISGITSLESLKPLRALLAIAEKYDDEQVRAYIEEYGDRSPCELKLEVMTYRENPSLLESQIHGYASDKNKLKGMIAGLKPEAPSRNDGFAAKKARIGIENREISRLNRSRLYGMVRRIFIRMGEILQAEGRISDRLDIFYLDMVEIENYESMDKEFKQIINERKREYSEYEKLPAHTRLVFRDGKLVDENVAKTWTDSFDGIGTSPGVITAEAVVLDSPNDKADVRGKIIVTKTTDPGWVFLLTMAGGIIAEKGSLLSHTAIVSRELGIPAVVAADNATLVIKTGDIVKLDGDTGRIQIVRAD